MSGRWTQVYSTSLGVNTELNHFHWIRALPESRKFTCTVLRQLRDPVATGALMGALFAARLDPVTITEVLMDWLLQSASEIFHGCFYSCEWKRSLRYSENFEIEVALL